jgi:deoxyribose-phosphate aldolase
MAFQPRGSSGFPKNPAGGSVSSGNVDAGSLNSLVDQIAEAVRERLISQGVPLPSDQGTASSSEPKKTAPWQQLIHHGADRISHTGEGPFQAHLLNGDEGLAAKIDHTLLKPDATPDEIKRVCEEARKYKFATVCVNSTYAGMVAELLKGSGVKSIAVVGFPLGAAATATKAFEAREAIKAGAQEIDMVINIGALKAREYAHVLDDIAKVVEASHPYPVKVILETSALDEDQKIIGCALSKAANAAFVKTSTGFGTGGATAEDIALMRRIVGPEMGVKASGGIRTYEDAAKMIAAGASRIGASASVAIVMHQSESAKGGKKSGTSGDTAKKPFKNSLY